MPETTEQEKQQTQSGFELGGLLSPIADMLRSIGQVGTGGSPLQGATGSTTQASGPPGVQSVYFARQTESPRFSQQTLTHTVVSGDTLGALASQHDTTVGAIQDDNGLSDTTIQVGQQLTITTTQEIGREVHYSALDSASVGDQVHLVVVTRGMRGKTLYPALRETEPPRLGNGDGTLTCQWDSADPAAPEVTVGALTGSDYLNAGSLADLAVIAVRLLPLQSGGQQQWRQALGEETTALYPQLRGDGALGYQGQSQAVITLADHQLTVDADLRVIEVVRRWETGKSTISEFTVPDARDNECDEGFFLERPGPDTVQSGQRKRIPEGTYQLRWHTTSLNSVKKFNPVPLLFNEEVPESRYILIHNGNKPDDTDGCLLIGSSRKTDFVGSSQDHYRKLLRYLRRVGIDNVTLRITSDY